MENREEANRAVNAARNRSFNIIHDQVLRAFEILIAVFTTVTTRAVVRRGVIGWVSWVQLR